MQRPQWSLSVVILALSLGLVGWNVSRFLNAKAVIRMDPHLEFLPDPEIARTLTLGHHNTAAKLRWIDSFSHLSYLMDHGAESGSTDGLRRLYRTLISLDPKFPSYYEHAATALGGMKGDVHGELALIALGLHHLPDSTRLWASLVAVLSVHYRLEERFPEQMEALLQRWGESERSKPGGNESLPGDWLAALARRHERGLEQLTYWGRLLLVSSPTAPEAEVARRIMSEQLARYGMARLEELVAAHTQRSGAAPDQLEAVLDAADLRAVYPDPKAAADPAEPIAPVADGFALRSDPYGLPYRLEGTTVVSSGLERFTFERRMGLQNASIRSSAIKRGRWPKDLDEAAEWLGEPLPSPPPGDQLELRNGLLRLRVPADATPWTDADLLAAAGLNPEGARH
jgi:transposase-like protein